MDLLTQLVSERASKERVLPGPDDVVVHIRSGDVRPEIDEVIATVQSLQPIKGALTVVTAMAFQSACATLPHSTTLLPTPAFMPPLT